MTETAWLERFGRAIDRVLNVLLFNGDDTATVSLHAALAERQGKRWGCVVCRVLSELVQRDHCAITLDPNSEASTGAAIRAGLLMASGIAGVWFLVDAGFDRIFAP